MMTTGCVTLQSNKTNTIHVFENEGDAEQFSSVPDNTPAWAGFCWVEYPNMDFENANFENVKTVIKHKSNRTISTKN